MTKGHLKAYLLVGCTGAVFLLLLAILPISEESVAVTDLKELNPASPQRHLKEANSAVDTKDSHPSLQRRLNNPQPSGIGLYWIALDTQEARVKHWLNVEEPAAEAVGMRPERVVGAPGVTWDLTNHQQFHLDCNHESSATPEVQSFCRNHGEYFLRLDFDQGACYGRNGERGCLMSHLLSVWRAFVNNDAYAVIVEADTSLKPFTDRHTGKQASKEYMDKLMDDAEDLISARPETMYGKGYDIWKLMGMEEDPTPLSGMPIVVQLVSSGPDCTDVFLDKMKYNKIRAPPRNLSAPVESRLSITEIVRLRDEYWKIDKRCVRAKKIGTRLVPPECTRRVFYSKRFVPWMVKCWGLHAYVLNRPQIEFIVRQWLSYRHESPEGRFRTKADFQKAILTIHMPEKYPNRACVADEMMYYPSMIFSGGAVTLRRKVWHDSRDETQSTDFALLMPQLQSSNQSSTGWTGNFTGDSFEPLIRW